MDAMWDDSDVCTEWVAAGEKRGSKVHMSRNTCGEPFVTQTEMRAMAKIVVERHFHGRVDLLMICAIAEVESDRKPLAYRFEPKLGEASTGLMQTLQSTAEWLAKDMGYTYYTNDCSSPMLYRPFVSVYFGAAFLNWLSTYKNKIQNEEFIVRAYNGGPKNATTGKTLIYFNKYLKSKQTLLSQSKDYYLNSVSKRPMGNDGLTCNEVDNESNSVSLPEKSCSRNMTSSSSSGMDWVYWDDKATADEMESLWRNETVKTEWLKSGETVGKVRFARDAEMRPYLTRIELKAVAEMVINRHFEGGLNPDMLCAVAEVCSRRLLYGWDSTNGILNLSLHTALWLQNSLGYKAYHIHDIEDLYRPFVSMYFAASYMTWLSTYENVQRTEQFIVKSYLLGPQNINSKNAGPYWLKYLQSLSLYQQETKRKNKQCGIQ
ncbi:hypothetical protein KP509_08G016300 [Ceratopteris richardii]|nr:hypothetical protein KP509_08G016300 [Ceratopteris richardii]